MDEIKKMIEFGNEIIVGNDSHIDELKKMIDVFFKDNDQEFFNGLDQSELKMIILLSLKNQDNQ